MELKKFISSIEKLIGKDQIRSAIDQFYAELNPNSPYYEAVLIQERNYEDYRGKIMKGIISNEDRRLEINLITNALLEILNGLSENDISNLILPEPAEELNDEKSKGYDKIITDHIVQNKKLFVENVQLREENEKLKQTDPRLKLKNLIDMNFSLFERYHTIADTLEHLSKKIGEDINSIDSGFAQDQIVRIEENLDGISIISEKLNVLSEKFFNKREETTEDSGYRLDAERLKVSQLFSGISTYCEKGLILSNQIISRTMSNLESLMESISEIELLEKKRMEDLEEEERNRERDRRNTEDDFKGY